MQLSSNRYCSCVFASDRSCPHALNSETYHLFAHTKLGGFHSDAYLSLDDNFLRSAVPDVASELEDIGKWESTLQLLSLDHLVKVMKSPASTEKLYHP